MRLLREIGVITELISVFKNDLYVGGADDEQLRDAAKVIFERLDEVMKTTGGDNIVAQLLKETRKDFVQFVTKVYENRHAPELKKFYFLYKKKNP